MLLTYEFFPVYKIHLKDQPVTLTAAYRTNGSSNAPYSITTPFVQ
jgi:hypothetical protein